jgi:hypothetical protein
VSSRGWRRSTLTPLVYVGAASNVAGAIFLGVGLLLALFAA